MKKYDLHLTISSSPHAHSSNNTRRIMLDVCIALLPAIAAGILVYGWRVLWLCLLSVAGCVFFEWGYRKVMKKDCTVGDLSAVVTGLLLVLTCPANVPWWMLLVGDLFAIVVVKQLFGGIGMNIINPALGARALMLFSWTSAMSSAAYKATMPVDAMASATPMELMRSGMLPQGQWLDLVLSKSGGSIGEASILALVLGCAYLLVRRVISLRIPLSYIGTVAVLAFLFPQTGGRLLWICGQLFCGGLFLGAIFMATDYTTSPITHLGQIIYGVGCGVVTLLLRYFGAIPEGVTFAITLMNCCVGLFDGIGIPRRYGVSRRKKDGEAA